MHAPPVTLCEQPLLCKCKPKECDLAVQVITLSGFGRNECTGQLKAPARAAQVICHGIPDRRPLEDGDIMNVDVTVYSNGYHGDLNETYVVGSVDDASKRLIRVTSEAR